MNRSDDLFAHGGDMGARMRTLDWSSTPLGPVETWPQSLKTCVRVILTSRQPMFVWWGDHLINLYNDAYCAILGGKHPEALGQPASVVWHEIWDQVGPRAESAMRGNEGTYDEALLLIMARNGYDEETYYTFSYSPVPNDQGGTGGILCANSDDTQSIVGARQLATLQELAAQTVDAKNAAEACTRSAEALRKNPRDLPFALLYLGESEKRVLTLRGAAGLAPGSAAAPEQIALDDGSVWPLGQVMRHGEAQIVGELATKLPDLPAGAWDRPPEQALLLPIAPSADKSLTGVLVVGLNRYRSHDPGYRAFLDLVSGQIFASLATAEEYDQEKRRNEALAALDRAKTTFFSNVSHEFRTPLTLMLGPLDDALALPAGALTGDELTMVHRNALRLLKLVNTLLDFSRIEAGRVQASYEPTDVAALTIDLASTFRSGVARGGLVFEVDCPPLPEPLWVDREMWEKIVLNLISNAFKFTFEGRIGVTLRALGDRVELSVSDTGVGIPEAELEHVFDRFHRIEGTRARTHEGSGIGLALVRDLVRLHGGDIRIQSELGRGTTLTVSIPRGTAHLPKDHVSVPRPATGSAARKESFLQETLLWLPPEAPESAPEVSPSSARILVADDNADMRSYVTRLLRQRWRVETASNGVQALESARQRRPDLVLTDAMMPEMDGFQLVRELRADPRTKTVPIIMLSARAGEDATAEGLRAGADDYLVKPFSASSLLARVESQLESARVRIEARQAAEQERQRLYALFMDGPAALCILHGQDLVIEMANRTILDAWGKTEAIIGKPLIEAVPALGGQGFDTLLHEVMRTGVPYRAQASHVRLDRRQDGTLEDLYFDFVYMPVRDTDGRIDGALVFAFEVTELVNARRASETARADAERAKAEAESASRAKDEFVAMLGHELRNPLAPILTAVDLMRLGDPANDELSRVVIERQVGHLVRLIDDLLDVSRIARGKVELKKETVEIAEVIAKATEMTSPLLEHDLSVNVPSQGLSVVGDVMRLAQVVANLLTNAFKYTERGGRVTVTGKREGGNVVVEVADTGIGISAEMLPTIFDMFVQERQTIERSHGGLGLGLAIVRNLVQAHGGTVTARSAGKGHGTTFSVSLPAAPAAVATQKPAPAPAPVKPARSRSLRVLLVDDNADAATLLGIFLRKLGHTIEVAHDGLSALEAAAKFAPEVALLDIGLPVMDGYELARRLRAQPETANLRLVAVTGYGQDTDRAVSRAAGFDLHLVKPVDRALIQSVLEGFAKETAEGPPASD